MFYRACFINVRLSATIFFKAVICGMTNEDFLISAETL